MTKEQASELLKKYNEGIASPAEIRLVENWFIRESRIRQSDPIDANYLDIKNKMWQVVDMRTRTHKTFRLWPRISIAAAVLCIALLALFYFSPGGKNNQSAEIIYKSDAAPGSAKAYLTLSSGERISLTDIPVGNIARQGATTVAKTAEGQLIYRKADQNAPSDPLKTNTITTPNGGLWQLILPDGTKVWLNAASSLIFPSSFKGSSLRKVELKGEAYFEVAKDKTHPFIVTTTHQQVEVLGTHFNINSYADEPVTRTTLLEGSVKVTAFQPDIKNAMVLKPGQQSVLSAAQLSVKAAYPEEEVAWKDNKFMFDGDNIQSIMRKIERWYDVEVVYEGNMDGKNFEGSISRFKNVSEVLRKLELTGTIHFRIEGRRITVMP